MAKEPGRSLLSFLLFVATMFITFRHNDVEINHGWIDARRSCFSLDVPLLAKELGLHAGRMMFEYGSYQLEELKTGEYVLPKVLQSLSQESIHHIHIEVFEREEVSSDCTSNDDDDDAECEKTCADKQLQFEDPNMQARYMYLKCKVYPATCTGPEERKSFRRECNRSYFLDSKGALYFGARQDQLRKKRNYGRVYMHQFNGARRVVATKAEMERIVDERHEHCHDARDRLLNGLNQFYYYPGMREVVEENRKNCDRCNEFQTVKKTVQSIISSRKMQIVMLDLFKVPMEGMQEELWVCVVKDHFTKFHWTKAFKGKDMGPIANFILQVFKENVVPEQLHSDNGSEFVNQCMKEVLRLLNTQNFTHGKPRHPQTQGLIERSNATIKTKLMKKCMDAGYTAPGQQFDWATTILQQVTDNENDAGLKVYGGVLNAFTAFHTVPRAAGTVHIPTPAAIDKMYSFMHECQLARAFKSNQFPVLEELAPGVVVNVLATKLQLKDHAAIASWSARGVVHAVCPMSEDAFSVRWLTPGLSIAKGKAKKADGAGIPPGAISMYYMRHQLRRVKNAEPAKVYETEHGNILITDVFMSKEATEPTLCNYVMLDGEWKGQMYSEDVKEFADCKFMLYNEYLTMTAGNIPGGTVSGRGKAAEEEARKHKRKKQKVSSTKMNHEEVAEVQKWLESPNPTLVANKPRHLRKGQQEEKEKNDIASTPISTSERKASNCKPYRSKSCVSPSKKPAQRKEIDKPENIVRPGEELVRPGSVLKVFDGTARWEGAWQTRGTLAIVTKISKNSKDECEELVTVPWTTFQPMDAKEVFPECVVMHLPHGKTASARMMNYDFARRPVLLVPGVLQLQDAMKLEQAWKENTEISQLFELLRTGKTRIGNLIDEERRKIVAAHPAFEELLVKAPSRSPRNKATAKAEKNIQGNKAKAEMKVQESMKVL
jgi:hypothetical protein